MPLFEVRREDYSYGVSPEERPLEELMRCGVALLDKPRGPSSHEVSSFVRKLLGLKKTGHSGTLDPNVSGVLPVMLENGCKLAPLLLGSPKEYVCVMKLGGKVTDKQLEAGLENFRGKIYQTPPLASAVKKALRVREIYELEVLERSDNLVLFSSRVQGGTYIRTLIRDLGLVLGVESSMAELRRTVAAGIPEGKCVTLQELSDRLWLAKERGDEKPLRECILPIEKVVKLKRIVVSDGAIKPVSTGANVALDSVTAFDDSLTEGKHVGIYSGKGELVCIAKALMAGSEIRDKLRGNERAICADVVRVIKSAI